MKFCLFLMFLCVADSAAQSNLPLRGELLKMVAVDQKAREECVKHDAEGQVKCLAETFEKIDKPHTKRLNEIFDRTGFPTMKTVGKEGVKAFMIMLQHTSDEVLRRKCLKPLAKGFKRREIPATDYANYVDRLLVHQNKPQIYGSNFDFKDGKLVMSAVKDRKNLDRRRRKIGLPPIEEYAKMLKEVYNLEVITSPIN